MACIASGVAALLVATVGALDSGHILPRGELVAEGHMMPHHSMSFMRHRGHERQLRICNAYPGTVPVDVYRGYHTKLTDEPMPYKSCRDFTLAVKVGDKMRFLMNDHAAGIFVVQAMPPDSSVLLLVIKRHDRTSTAVSFQSHVFTRHSKAQVAMINTFQGSDPSTVRIARVSTTWPARSEKNVVEKDVEQALGTAKQEQQAKAEQLKCNSLSTFEQGMYDVNLTRADGATVQRRQLVALNRESYVIFVSGFEDDDGNNVPQDLVVYPHSDANQLPKPAGASTTSLALCAVLAVIANLASSVV